MQSYRFLPTFHENFSKTVHTIFIKFCTVILHPKEPLRAQWHQNCMTGMSETDKISPKMAKKLIFRLFSIFSKTVHTIFIKFCTVILHPKEPLRAQWHQNCMTGMSETDKISPKMAKKQPFSTFFDFLKNCPYDWKEISTVIF